MSDTPEGLLGRAGARSLLESALRRSAAEQAEAVLTYERSALTRFADNYIHQNVAAETPQLTVRAVFGRRVGIASTGRLDDEGLARVVEAAERLARAAAENEEFHGLPEPNGEPGQPGEATYSAATATYGPETRAAMAGVVCRIAREAGLSASGYVTTTGQELAVASTRGIFAYTPRSVARVVAVANGAGGSGYAQDTALDVAALDVEALAARAVAIARQAQQPIEVAPAPYTVILQPEAVADIAGFLADLGFGAQAVYENRSFVSGKRGERVLRENVTIWDDGHDPAGLPLPFDVEGLPRRRLSLIEHGVAGDIALDSLYAGLLGAPRSTGHARQVANDFYTGPIPQNVFIAPGESTLEEMIRTTARGLLVTHFHYTRVVHRLHVIITGMTRYGTFLIEHGEITRPVKNLRYTQSYLDALRDVQASGRETRLVADRVAARVPALKIGSFTFTGATQ